MNCVVYRREDPAEDDLHPVVSCPDLAGQDLGVRVGGGGQEAQPHQIGFVAADLLDDYLGRRLRVGLVEHQALVPGPLDNRC
jgi:hypothetical protein